MNQSQTSSSTVTIDSGEIEEAPVIVEAHPEFSDDEQISAKEVEEEDDQDFGYDDEEEEVEDEEEEPEQVEKEDEEEDTFEDDEDEMGLMSGRHGLHEINTLSQLYTFGLLKVNKFCKSSPFSPEQQKLTNVKI